MGKAAKGIEYVHEIRRQIENKEFSRVYLLTGDEGYLIQWARNALMQALGRPDDEMNVARFVSESVDYGALRDLAVTYPFFSERRVILLDETGAVKFGKDEFLSVLKDIPDTTVLIIAEEDVDKRSSVYKWIKKNGFVMEALKKDHSEQDMLNYIAGWMKKAGKKISRKDASYLYALVGADLYMLKQEVDKLIAYSGDEPVIKREDIESIVSAQIENKIFDLMDAVSDGDVRLMQLRYNDLIMLREEPMRILYLVARQYRILMIVHEMTGRGASDEQTAKAAGIHRYFVRKSRKQLRGYDEKLLMDSLEACLATEESIKTGRITDRIGLETLLFQLTEKIGVQSIRQ